MYYDYESKMISHNPQLGLLCVHDDICDLMPLIEMDIGLDELNDYLSWIDQLLEKSEGYLLKKERISLFFSDVLISKAGDIKLKYMEVGYENKITTSHYRNYYLGLMNKKDDSNNFQLSECHKAYLKYAILCILGLCLFFISRTAAVTYILLFIMYLLKDKFKLQKAFKNTTMVMTDPESYLKGLGMIKDVHGLVDKIIIGRSKVCDICIDEPYVGKKHAKLYKKKEGFYLHDLASKNGTYLNGQLLHSRVDKRIKNGDIIRIGSYEFEFVQ